MSRINTSLNLQDLEDLKTTSLIKAVVMKRRGCAGDLVPDKSRVIYEISVKFRVNFEEFSEFEKLPCVE